MEPFNPYAIYHDLYKEINGHTISRSAQKKTGIYLQSFTYGEVTYRGFYEILRLINPHPDEIFYDLGSGTGKAVFITSLLTPCKKSIGIEILKDLYLTSEKIKEHYTHQYLPTLPPYKQTQKIEFHHADFTKYDYTDGDIIFMNSIAFSYEFDDVFTEKLQHLKKGTRIILLGEPLELPHFTVIAQNKHVFSWDHVNTVIYIKK
jgi:SAM-dependent methyltransferase